MPRPPRPSSRAPHRRLLALLALVTAVATLSLTGAPPTSADAPAMTSGNGITVTGWRWITSRTLEVDISTAKVAANAVNGPHRVRITLPSDYFQSGSTRYPVLYLLHGGAGGNAAQWTTGGGAVDYGLFNQRLWLTLEAYDFSRANDLDPHLRLTGRWWLTPNLFITGGYDDPLVSERDSFIFGGGIRWNDDDLKYLLGSVPKL